MAAMSEEERRAGSGADWDKLAFPRVCGLLAERPTKLSLAMHSAGFADRGLPFSYIAFDTTDTAGALRAMRVLGIRGLSLTIPHKEAAMPLVDATTDRARRLGAINTVVNSGTSLLGTNTDYDGIVAAFAEAGAVFTGKRVLLWGAGGAASAALAVAIDGGAAEVAVSSRSFDRADALAHRFRQQGASVRSVSAESIAKLGPDVLINATPMGSHLADHDTARWPLDRSDPYAPVVFDMVTRDTPLLEHCRMKGGVAIHGLRMLLHQAVRQFEIFTGESAPISVMEKALAEASGDSAAGRRAERR